MSNPTERMVVPGKRLGRGAPPHDPMLLALHRYTDVTKLPAAPASCDLAAACKSPWGMMLNTSIGDCTAADAGHSVQVWTANADAGQEITLTDADVEKFYELFGYVPGKSTTDNGANIATVNKKLKAVGIGGHKIAAYGAVSPSDDAQAAQALYVFGGLHVGWNMPVAAQKMPTTWDVPAGTDLTSATWKPGGWGGHDTVVVGYEPTGDWTIVSWGQLFSVTPSFRRAYLEEVWARVSPDWIEANGTSPDGGFDVAQLDTDVAALDGGPARP